MYQNLCTEFYDNDKPLATDDEVSFYGQFFNKNHLILEPMCGTGRLLIPLLRAGFKLQGYDNSPHMLANCQKRLHENNLHAEIFEASVMEFDSKLQYDGIIIPFGSFQLIHPRLAAYEALSKFYLQLKPGGKLILDMFIPWETMYPGGEEQSGKKATTFPDGSIISHSFHIVANKWKQSFESQDTYEKIINNKVIAKEEETMHLCWYFLCEFELILEKHGFRNINRIEKTINEETLTAYIAER